MLQIIPRPVHAILDYVYGSTALMAPMLFSFDHNRKANQAATGIGIAALLSGLITRHEGGLVELLDFNTHLKLDTVGAMLILAVPWFLGFSDNPRARNTIIGLALLEAVVVFLTQPDKK